MANRLILRKIIPDMYQIFMQLSEAVEKAGIKPLYQELIKIRASQINGCAYCLHKHSQDAIAHGEDPKRLYVLSAWREARNWFSNEEQVILKLTEEVTLISHHGLSDQTYDDAVELFGETGTAQLIVAVININALNRMAIALTMHP
jgi:AhpD family alkylhydroperoxidase